MSRVSAAEVGIIDIVPIDVIILESVLGVVRCGEWRPPGLAGGSVRSLLYGSILAVGRKFSAQDMIL